MREKVCTVTKDDVEFQTFRAGGKGGQNANKVSSGVRAIHHPSGARGESREERSQLLNKRKAFRRMAESKEFTRWVKIESGIQLTVEAEVEKQMKPANLRVEIREDDQWVTTDANSI